MRILLFNETKHIGGAQTTSYAYRDMLSRSCIAHDFVENGITQNTIRKIIKKEYTKAILNLYTLNYLWLVFLLKITGIPIMQVIHGLWFLETKSHNPSQSPEKTLWLKIAQGIILLLSEKLIVFTDYEKRLVEHHYPWAKHKITIVPGSVNSAIFYPVSRAVKKKIRKQLHLPEHSKILLVVARLERRKGIDLAIEAFSKIMQNYKNSFLLIIFPTAEFSYVENALELFKQIASLHIGERIHFLTGIERKNIPLYFQASDIFLMSSRELETFGLTTLEAASCGCIPVGFDSGATPELLNQIDQHLIARPTNAEALSQTIDWVLSLSISEQKKLRPKCLSMTKKYSLEIVSKPLLQCLS